MEEKKIFIQAFIKGYVTSNMQRFEKQDGKYLVKRVRCVSMEKIEHLAVLNAIRCLMTTRPYNGQNFTLGEILDALDKNSQEAQKIKEDLNKLPSWTS